MFNHSPFQVLMGRGANIQEVCPHRPLETKEEQKSIGCYPLIYPLIDQGDSKV